MSSRSVMVGVGRHLAYSHLHCVYVAAALLSN